MSKADRRGRWCSAKLTVQTRHPALNTTSRSANCLLPISFAAGDGRPNAAVIAQIEKVYCFFSDFEEKFSNIYIFFWKVPSIISCKRCLFLTINNRWTSSIVRIYYFQPYCTYKLHNELIYTKNDQYLQRLNVWYYFINCNPISVYCQAYMSHLRVTKQKLSQVTWSRTSWQVV